MRYDHGFFFNFIDGCSFFFFFFGFLLMLCSWDLDGDAYIISIDCCYSICNNHFLDLPHKMFNGINLQIYNNHFWIHIKERLLDLMINSSPSSVNSPDYQPTSKVIQSHELRFVALSCESEYLAKLFFLCSYHPT